MVSKKPVSKKQKPAKNKNSTESRVLKEMVEFFNLNSRPPRLDDLLLLKLGNEKKGLGITFNLDKWENPFYDLISLDFGPGKPALSLPVATCPSTGFKYFYLVLPLEYINNDIQLQPRPLELKRLWELFRHLSTNTQLTPSICRISENKIWLFDGQHKAAAQIWAGRDSIECKVYIEPDIKTLKETNLIAHDKLRQLPFFTSVLINKWASIFEEEWKQYLEQKGQKSEAGFVSLLAAGGKKKNDAVTMIESNIYDSILEDKENRIRKYLEEYGKDSKKPLTINRLKQSIFKKFITSPPLSIDIEESDRLREIERKNIIRLLNLLTDYSLEGKWNNTNEANLQKIPEKIFLNGSLKAWAAILKDVIANILELYDEDERKEIFLREIPEEKWEQIEKSINILFSNHVWFDDSQENYNNLRISNESLVKKYLARRGLNANWILNSYYEEDNNFID